MPISKEIVWLEVKYLPELNTTYEKVVCIVLKFPLQFHELAGLVGDPPKQGLAKYGYKSYKQV